MGILSKMLFNFRKAADALCEASSGGKTTIHTCLAGAHPHQISKGRHLFTITYVELIGMQGELVGWLTNCLPSEISSQYAALIFKNNATA